MLSIIRTIFIEHRRQKRFRQFLGIAVFRSLLTILGTTISLSEGNKIMNDMRISGIEMAGVLSIIFFVAHARGKVHKNHTLHLLLTHYPHKGHIYVAHTMAHMILIATLYIIMSTVAYITIRSTGHTILDGMTMSIGLSFVKMIGLITIAQRLGSVSSGYIASLCSLLIYIIGHSTGFILYYLQKQSDTGLVYLGKILYYFMPNFQALDHYRILYHELSSLDIIIGISIMIAYSIIMTGVGIWSMHRQEL